MGALIAPLEPLPKPGPMEVVVEIWQCKAEWLILPDRNSDDPAEVEAFLARLNKQLENGEELEPCQHLQLPWDICLIREKVRVKRIIYPEGSEAPS